MSHTDTSDCRPSQVCHLCDKPFATNSNLKRHLKNVHSHNEGFNRTCLKCPICQDNSSCFENYEEHVKNEHGISIKTDILEFPSKSEFYDWKRSLEEKQGCSFISKHSSKKLVTNDVSAKYHCHRSGHFSSKVSDLERKRQLKVQGSCKINGYCPANLKVIFLTDGSVHVSFCSSHIGHKLEIGHLTLHKEVRSDLAAKIASKVPFDAIIEDVRSTADEDLKRKHLLTKQDLYNIQKEFGLSGKAVRHSDDATSIDAWVEEENMSGNSCVMLYKPQGIDPDAGCNLRKEDFALAIMNSAQAELLKKYGSDCICVDATHGMNAYGFQLTTLMVLDDLRQGFPCAFFISNRADRLAIEDFFKSVRNEVGIIKAKTFMSDMDDIFYDAWANVMEDSGKKLYCTWHVDRAWRKNLPKIKNVDKQKEVYKKLRTLLEETDQMAFEQLLPILVNEMEEDPLTQEYAQYFMKYYVPKAKQWAYCYRLNAGVNTNMHLERMHSTIKHCYLQGKHVKRLDKAVHAIMQLIKNKLFDRLICMEKGKITTKLKELRDRHKKSLSLNTDLVLQTSENSWEVAGSGQNCYSVKLINPICDCQINCNHCKSCLHKFDCSCIDASIKWNMCKHIHLVCRWIGLKNKSLSSTVAQSHDESPLVIDDQENEEKSAVLKEIFVKNDRPKASRVTQEMKDKIIQEFSDLVNNVDSIDNYNIIRKNVKSLIPLMESLEKGKHLTIPVKDNSHVNKKIDPQRKFIVKKKTKRMRSIQRPNAAEVQQIALSAIMSKNHFEDHVDNLTADNVRPSDHVDNLTADNERPSMDVE